MIETRQTDAILWQVDEELNEQPIAFTLYTGGPQISLRQNGNEVLLNISTLDEAIKILRELRKRLAD